MMLFFMSRDEMIDIHAKIEMHKDLRKYLMMCDHRRMHMNNNL
jgi:hypothetical protein